MNEDPMNARSKIIDLQIPAQPQPQTILPARPKVTSRHGTTTGDLYSLQGYKTWMNNARENWKDT
jgi:hypothetical protein